MRHGNLKARQRVKRDPPTGAPPQVDSLTGSYSVLHSTTTQTRVTRCTQTPGVRRLRQQAAPVQVRHSRPPCNNDEATTPMVWHVVPKLSVACPGCSSRTAHANLPRAYLGCMLAVTVLCVLSNSTGGRIVVAHARVGRHGGNHRG